MVCQNSATLAFQLWRDESLKISTSVRWTRSLWWAEGTSGSRCDRTAYLFPETGLGILCWPPDTVLFFLLIAQRRTSGASGIMTISLLHLQQSSQEYEPCCHLKHLFKPLERAAGNYSVLQGTLLLERGKKILLLNFKKKKSKIILKSAWFSSLSPGNFRPASRVCVWKLVCPAWLIHFQKDATLGSFFSPLLHTWVQLPPTVSPWCEELAVHSLSKRSLPRSLNFSFCRRRKLFG